MASISVPDLICNNMEIDWSEPFSAKACRLFLLRICPLCWNCVLWFRADSSATAARASNALSLSSSPTITFNLRCWSWINVSCYLLFVFLNQVRSPLNLPLQVMKLWVQTNLHKYLTCSIVLSFMHEMKWRWIKSLCFLIIDL